MKKLVSIFVLMLTLGVALNAFAQGGAEQVKMNATTNGTTKTIPGEGIFLYDDDAAAGGHYSANNDFSIILQGACEAPNRLSITFESFDIAPTDTLYVYDGNSTNALCILTCNNNMNPQGGKTVYTTNLNNTNCLTVRFVTHSSNGAGFSAMVNCKFPCEVVVPIIEEQFDKYRDGVKIGTGTIKNFIVYDTVLQVNDDGDTVQVVQPNTFRGVNLCLGEDVVFHAHGEYTHEHGAYTPMDATTLFKWNFGNGDTLYDLGAIQAMAIYHDLDCYDVVLQMEDEQGCKSSMFESVRVRIAQNPIKTLFDLATICNSDSLLVNVGYEGENGTLTLKKISFEKMKTQTYAAMTFIPDGPNCPIQCFVAPVTFNDFPSGRTVQGGEDICSICVNFEHEFMGDYKLAVICPSNNTSRLKTKENDPVNAAGGGSGTFNGYPYGGNAHHTYDGSGNNICDELYNMYGVGLDYCFSRNVAYQYNNVDNPANKPGIGSNSYIDQVTFTFAPIPAPFQNSGATAGTQSFSTCHPSNHASKTEYYMPYDDFHELIGCPLNGNWSIELCDTWGSDNGWIFSWSLDICGISSGAGCEYQVGLDSVIWTPDTAFGDFDLGHWRGATIWDRDSVNCYVATPDTAGTFPIHVTLYDEFGCVWDTITRITSVWTPHPDLGADRILCDVETTILDARDAHTASTNQSFMWEPFGDTTATITTHNNTGTSILYTVEVTNQEHDIRCRNRDSVRVNTFVQPTPNFDPGIYPLEGCEPFTIHIQNTSQNGDYYRWEFGDGDTSTAMNPTHTYSAGRYGFKYYISTKDGCKDSLIYDDLITVFSSPVAKFSWEPVNPTVLHPQVQFINMTEPQSDENKYYWEIQYDRDNSVSYHTLRDVNPSFEWYTNGEDISGNYIARLIAKTDQMGPSGNIVECRDTIENKILLVNDFLQFPNVVTANGDGVNDRFEIGNLVNGMGYPNNSLAIYNRWGKRVYYKENISSEEDFWDPAADNQPAGTYFWRFSGKGYLGNIQRNGVVEVLR